MPHSNTNPWLVVAFASLMQAVSIGIAVYSFAFFVLPWMNDFQTSRTSILLAATIQSAVVVLLSPIAGSLMDKYDSKKLMLVAALIFCIALLGISFAPSHIVVIALFGGVLPLGVTFCGPLMGYSMVARTNIDRKGLAMGIAALGTSFGGFVFAPLITQLLAHTDNDWRFVFQLLAVVTFFLVFLLGLFVIKSNQPTAVTPASNTESSRSKSNFKLTLSPDVIKLGLCYMLPSMLFIAILHNVGGIAADLDIKATKASIITSIASVLMAIGKVSMGALSDKLNHRLIYLSIIFVLIIGAVITALANNYGGLFIGVCTVAFALGGVAPLIANIVSRHWSQANFGRVMGMVHAFAGASGFGALLAGYIRDVTDSYSAAFFALAALLVLAAFIFLTLPKISVNTKPLSTP